MNYEISLFESIPNTVATFEGGRLTGLTEDPFADPEDPMQQYGTGTITGKVLDGGVGWDDIGSIEYGVVYRFAWDDMESLAEGSVTALTGGTGWAADGVIV